MFSGSGESQEAEKLKILQKQRRDELHKLKDVRRSTKLDKSVDNLCELDYDKMELNTNLNHPRLVDNTGKDGNIKFN